MATTTARTKEDVNGMSKADRLWDSLNYSYGKKRESSDEQYDKAYSQADRQALSRGMQRSSYNNQVLGNLSDAKVKAQNDIWDTQIADYENRLGEIEQQEAAQDQWERQFAAEREDAAWQKEYQQAQADEAKRQYDTSLAYQKERDTVGDTQWNQQFEANRADTAWSQQFQQNQADLQKEQWEREFGFNEKTTDQKIAMEYAMSILQNGQMPSDDLLARAGLSAEDAQRMIAQSGGSGGRSSGKTSEQDQPDEDATNTFGHDTSNQDPLVKQFMMQKSKPGGFINYVKANATAQGIKDTKNNRLKNP